MNAHDSLREATDEEVAEILNQLKPLIPDSTHAYYFIDSIYNWKKKMPDLDAGILCPVGGPKSGAVFFYSNGFRDFFFSAYFWSEEGEKNLQDALIKTRRFNWEVHQYVSFSGWSFKVWTLFQPLLPKIFGNRPTVNILHKKLYWLPAEEAVRFDIRVPEGMKIQALTEEHVKIIDSEWPHKTEESHKLIETMTWVNFGLGLCNSRGELVSWGFYWFYGGLGVVQTAENEKRKGYGKLIVKAVCKEMGSRGIDIHLFIVKGNYASEALFKSLGFKSVSDGVWATSFKDSF